VVEQETHKLLVGSSNLPLGTTIRPSGCESTGPNRWARKQQRFDPAKCTGHKPLSSQDNAILKKERAKWRFLGSYQSEAAVASPSVDRMKGANAANLDLERIPSGDGTETGCSLRPYIHYFFEKA
jgi:hypothetical protein